MNDKAINKFISFVQIWSDDKIAWQRNIGKVDLFDSILFCTCLMCRSFILRTPKNSILRHKK